MFYGKEIEELAKRVGALENKKSAKDNVIWEASFKKTLRLARRRFLFGDGEPRVDVKVFKGPGVIREFKDSSYLVIAFVDSDAVTFIEKSEADELNLDHPSVEAPGA